MKYFERNHSYKYELAEVYYQDIFFDNIVTVISGGNKYIYYGDNHFVIQTGYAWDGSSIPFKRFLEKITFGKYDADRYCKEASLVHDAFYQLMRLNLLSRDHKEAIDRLYEKMCIEGATKIIKESYVRGKAEILMSGWSDKKKTRKLHSLTDKKFRLLGKLPAWAARRYWAVSKFGARTLKPRYRPEKIILST